jgi:hypothetical protein
VDLDCSVAHGLHHRELSETHPRERADAGLDLQIDFVTGIEEAEIDIGALEHEPEDAVPVSAEVKQENDPLVR